MRQLSDLVYRDNLRVKHQKKRKLEETLQKHDEQRRQLCPAVAGKPKIEPMATLIIEHILEDGGGGWRAVSMMYALGVKSRAKVRALECGHWLEIANAVCTPRSS